MEVGVAGKEGKPSDEVVSNDRVRTALAAELAFDDLDTAERMAVLNQLEREVFQPRGDSALARALAVDPTLIGLEPE